MRRALLAALGLVCASCRAFGREAPTLVLTASDGDDDVVQGVLTCPEPGCRREHPVVDGIPVVVPDLRAWAAHQLPAVLARRDLDATTRSLLADAAGPGTPHDLERRNRSIYVDAHHAATGPGSLAALVDVALGLLPAPPGGDWADLGCGPGGGTFALARAGAAVAVGVDLSFSFLRDAEALRRTGGLAYDRRRVGLVSDEVQVRADLPEGVADRVAFVCADAAVLPFADGRFGGAMSLNVVDSVHDPVGHALELGRVLGAGGRALLSSPYDWAATTAPLERWVGGHSQRGASAGASEAELRRLFGEPPVPGLDSGLRITGELDRVPWHLRVHDRSTMTYECHVVALERR